MKKYLGIDQSYRSTGIVVMEDNNLIHCERFVSDETKDVYERAEEIAMHIQLVALNYTPDVIGIEGLSFGSKGNVTRDLGGLIFTIILQLKHVGWNPHIIAPPTVKKTATNNGRAKKNEVINALPHKIRTEFDALGVKKTTGLSDLADAYWIAKTVAKSY